MIARYKPAVAQLKIDLHMLKTNEPINRKEGNIKQADLERTTAASITDAITLLTSEKPKAERLIRIPKKMRTRTNG